MPPYFNSGHKKGAPKGSHSVLVGYCYYGSNRNAMIKA